MPTKKVLQKIRKLRKLIKADKKLKVQLRKVEKEIENIPYTDIPYSADIPYRDHKKRKRR